MKRSEGEDEEKRDEQRIELKVRSSLYKRPYGLLSQAGIATDGMTPREAWSAVNELRRAEAAARRAEKEAKKQPKAAKKSVKAAPKPVPNKKTEEKRTTAAFEDGTGGRGSFSFIEKAPNGKYFNNYGYDKDLCPQAPSSAGAFASYGEAERALYKHRPNAVKLKNPHGKARKNKKAR